MMPYFDVLADVLQHATAHFFGGSFDGTAESEYIRRTVTLDYDTLQSEQARAVVAAMIHPALERIEYRHRHQCSQLGEYVPAKFFTQKSAQHLRQPFGGFQCHVADETVTYHHVGRAFEYVVAFDVTVKIQITATQQFRGLLDHFIAFDAVSYTHLRAHETDSY